MRDEPTLRVMVVDDHAGIRMGVSKLVDAWQPHMQTVGTAACADEALTMARLLLPDVVVLDADLGDADGLALIEPLTRCLCRVVVLSACTDPLIARRALLLGAEAAIHKSEPGRALWGAILGVADDEDEHGAETDPANEGGEMSRSRGSK